MAPANLVNLERVSKSFGVRPLLSDVSIGVQEDDRIGVVGRNGDGKTTLLRVLAGVEAADSGRVTHTRGLRLGMVSQHDDLDDDSTVRSLVLGSRAEHEWAGDATVRGIVQRLLMGVELDRSAAGLSGGERRRVSLARLLVDDNDLLLLDEPTNHLDIEAVAWLAEHLAARTATLVVVTHDRWFLDAVCTTTWEVHDGHVDSYDGGYAAYVLAKAERLRQAASAETRRQNLVRKELAWLRRGPPARTSKPRFRIDAANAIIADEPPARDRVELKRFAMSRLGKDVLDIEDATITRGGRDLVDRATWRIGPGDRIGLVGVNGAGKTSLLSVLAGDIRPDAGRLRVGRTVEVGYLTQALDDVDPDLRVLASVEQRARVLTLESGKQLSATSMLERFGFTRDKLITRVGDLSGGERRRLQLLRLLIAEPNVLLLDEPTNDLDIDTLNVIEDHLDHWPGTLVVVSHDRYFLERVCDTVWGVLGDGTIGLLPGGVDEYLARRRDATPEASARSSVAVSSLPSTTEPGTKSDAQTARRAKKELARLDRQLARLSGQIDSVHDEMAVHASDFERLGVLDAELRRLEADRDQVESAWLEAAERID